ncbi:porphobilinogen deaminase [Alkalihalobacillus alcalophilus ATCC 27647 = CGMCC 1.3604]|uniref:Porphobilinogen deaminase n=1 Tax=Alkalihalobacillus alcalophilus ATCC 27647 = CGMCC 1.3604 TaxID=1218173 RepID=A0A094YX37_ALKAL|nr:hydroxymethylbilane synthase [Alkalihalobacillus alcalophilus]KGA98092.1 porphobilinogen deaminase [Alkalihalobacillus alcalophilus ATCC 27647 = CGMCC 1.3604]MED1561429.1 hydroxymethylbilane synthase [Alkalihalobacillus alcalophilus]THG90703.1 porphobilinogen deaminase [Alkalihalobacillus alcalophilus ATCC 27647 = CGMCC 1.3604]
MRKIVIGSRKSNLALTQTNWVIDQLKKVGAPFEFEVKKIVTKGDRILDVTLSKVGGKGLFVKEIERALADGEIDMAVHSMKDVPSELQPGFTIGAVPEREDPRDALISNNHVKLADLPSGSIVGTSSLRRSAQLLAERPDLEIQWIRGNVETRLSKLEDENFDAIILAAAGLKRLGYSEELVTEYLDTETCIPAVGQGALGIECRSDDEEVKQLLAEINDTITERIVTAERAFLHKIEGGCQVPIAAYGTLQENGDISLTALVGSPDGKTILKETRVGNEPVELGVSIANTLLEQGAREILDKVKKESGE